MKIYPCIYSNQCSESDRNFVLLLKRHLKACLVHVWVSFMSMFSSQRQKKCIFRNRIGSPHQASPFWMAQTATKLLSQLWTHYSVCLPHHRATSKSILLERFGILWGMKVLHKIKSGLFMDVIPCAQRSGQALRSELCRIWFSLAAGESPLLPLLCPFCIAVSAAGFPRSRSPVHLQWSPPLCYNPHCNLSGPISRVF